MVVEAIVGQPEVRTAPAGRRRAARPHAASTAGKARRVAAKRDAERPDEAPARLPIDAPAEAREALEAAEAAPTAAIIESLLFVAQGPVAVADLARALELPRPTVLRAIDVLAADCRQRGLRVQRGEGTVRLVTAPESAAAVQRFLGLELAAPLTRAALETLSIIAYRQPLTRPEVDALRGVSSDGVLRTLLARGLVEPVGRRETVGHPFEYGTTYAFLDYFGLAGLDELPPLPEALVAEAARRAGEAVGDAEEPEGGATAEWSAFAGQAEGGAAGSPS